MKHSFKDALIFDKYISMWFLGSVKKQHSVARGGRCRIDIINFKGKIKWVKTLEKIKEVD